MRLSTDADQARAEALFKKGGPARRGQKVMTEQQADRQAVQEKTAAGRQSGAGNEWRRSSPIAELIVALVARYFL
jgi:hypothetical protein